MCNEPKGEERTFLNGTLLFKQTELKGARITAAVYHHVLVGNLASL